MNAPPFPIAPQVGESFQNWVWNGARWVATPTTGLRLNTVVFTASGPYMPSPGLVSLQVECIGGGGGGGGITSVTSGLWLLMGGGGGSGGLSRKTLPAALVRGGVLVTVGDGGAQGITDQAGQGGTTSFGALCIAFGGYGGWSVNPATGPWGMAGGGASTGVGDQAFPGATGDSGALTELTAAQTSEINTVAGGQMFGGNFVETVGTGAWSSGMDSAPNTGAGGAGAAANQVQSSPALVQGGGAGGSGLCTVTEFLWGDRDQPDIGFQPPLDVNVKFPRPPWPGGGPWPPGAWWPPGGWWGPGPWGPGPGRSSVPGPQSREAVEFEANQPYDDQSINPETGMPWEDAP